MRVWDRLRAAFRRKQLESELDEEMRSHLALATEDYLRQGKTPEEARRLARVKFGSVEASKDAHRDARGSVWLQGLFHDFRFAMRALRRDPMFAATAILMLTLAVALNVMAFRVMNSVLFRGPRLVKDNDRVLYLSETVKDAGCCVSYFDFDHWRRGSHAFQELAFMAPRQITLAEGDADGRDLWTDAWTPNVFHLLGVSPILGRDFEPADARPGAPPVVIADYHYWQIHLGARSDIIGKTVRVNGEPATVIGVLPEGFDFGRMEVWLPLTDTPQLLKRIPNGGEVLGRLAPGATEAQARAELEAIDQRLANEYPDSNRGVLPVVNNFREQQGPAATLIYGTWCVGAWFVLWIACANVANLTLARTESRARELSTRMALGAGRGRVIRQLFLEHFLLTATAGLAAWILSDAAVRTWEAATGGPYTSVYDYSPSAGIVFYLVGVVLGSAGWLTVAPLLRLRRLDANGVLRGESRNSTMTLGSKQLSAVLVAGQMALAIILIASAGVLGRSLWNILNADVGVEAPERVLMGHITFPRERYRTPESRVRFIDQFQARLGTLAGVEVAAMSSARPLEDFEPRAIEVEARPNNRYATPIFAAGPGYFRAIGARVQAGRGFTSADRPGASAVAIVNQRFADIYFPGGNALGQRIRILEKYELEPDEWRTIVGVASNVMQNDYTRQQFRPVAYVPLAQRPGDWVWFFARTTRVSGGLAAAIRGELRELDPKLEITDYSTLKAGLGFSSLRGFHSVEQMARNAVIVPVYAALALFLAAIGLYAVVARSVGRRTKEVGVRMALGAAPGEIQRLILVEALAPVFAGLVIGLAASLAVNRVLQSQLVGVSPYDTVTLAIAPLILLLVAILGCLFPVRQAMRVDPAVALRHD